MSFAPRSTDLMPKRSAGLLLYNRTRSGWRVLLGHPGGPFWARRDAGAWSIPKGEHDATEEPLAAALREFAEETGFSPVPDGVIDLGEAAQPSRKIVHAFGLEGDLDPRGIKSNLIEIAWPPRTGRRLTIPEIDRAAWFEPAEALARILPGQRVFLDRLADALGSAG